MLTENYNGIYVKNTAVYQSNKHIPEHLH